MADLTKLRDDIIKRKALMQAAKADAEVAIKDIKDILDSFSEDEVKALEEQGFDIFGVFEVDYDRLQTDADYLESYKEKIEVLSDRIYELLEAQLV